MSALFTIGQDRLTQAVPAGGEGEQGARPVHGIERDGRGRISRARPVAKGLPGACFMRHSILCLAVFLAGAGPARAEGCFGPGVPLFHCTVRGGEKAVDLCLQGDVAYYRFGPPRGVAEMLLARPVGEVHMIPWNGIGRTIHEEAGFLNGPFKYSVHYAIDRVPQAGEIKVTTSGGVTILDGDQFVAQLRCDEGSVSVADVYPLYEAKEAAGQCWDREAFRWGRC